MERYAVSLRRKRRCPNKTVLLFNIIGYKPDPDLVSHIPIASSVRYSSMLCRVLRPCLPLLPIQLDTGTAYITDVRSCVLFGDIVQGSTTSLKSTFAVTC
jgi:hypothetical protein